MLSVIFFVFNEMKLKICFRTFLVDMRIKLSEIHGAKFETGNCNLSLEYLHCLCLIEKQYTQSFSRKILMGSSTSSRSARRHYKSKGLLIPCITCCALHNKKKSGHCMAIVHKRDSSNPTVLMEIYVQKGQYWPKCDKHANSIKQIAVYSVNKAIAEEWEDKCGIKICEADCLILVLTCRKNRKNRGFSGPRSPGIFMTSVI